MLVGKYSVEDEKLLAERVVVRGKRTRGSIADKGSGARDFAADAIEQTAFDACLGRWDPGQFVGGDHDAAGEIGVDEFI